ncbi:MAG: hypothetical protein AB1846_01070 [Chloroflexota bacterium]
MVNQPFSKPILPDIPDFFSDRMRLTVTVFGVNFTFGLGAPHPDDNSGDLVGVLELVRVRMSLEHAKIMAMLLKKQIKDYEQMNETEVAIPKKVLEALNLSDENW